MKQVLVLAIAVMFYSGVAFASDESILGKFKAVTESELVIELCLYPDKSAHLLGGYYPVEDEDVDSRSVVKGTWSVKNDSLTLKLKDERTYEYKITRDLSYSEFGYSGEQIGLKPVKTNYQDALTFYELWRPEVIESIFNFKVSDKCLIE